MDHEVDAWQSWFTQQGLEGTGHWGWSKEQPITFRVNYSELSTPPPWTVIPKPPYFQVRRKFWFGLNIHWVWIAHLGMYICWSTGIARSVPKFFARGTLSTILWLQGHLRILPLGRQVFFVVQNTPHRCRNYCKKACKNILVYPERPGYKQACATNLYLPWSAILQPDWSTRGIPWVLWSRFGSFCRQLFSVACLLLVDWILSRHMQFDDWGIPFHCY